MTMCRPEMKAKKRFHWIRFAALLIGMMISFVIPAYAADLKLKVDALNKAKDAFNGCQIGEDWTDVYSAKPADIFEGVNGTITFQDIFNCLQRYGKPSGIYWEMQGHTYEGFGFVVDNLEVAVCRQIGQNWPSSEWDYVYDKWRQGQYDQLIIRPEYTVCLYLGEIIDNRAPDPALKDQMIARVASKNQEGTTNTVQNPASATSGTTSHSGVWFQDSNGWWYCNANGTYTTNDWQQIDGSWYYFNQQGYMVTGWRWISDGWYYFYPNGKMASNTWIEGNYYLGASGKMLTDTFTPDGYYVDWNGKVRSR